MAEFPDTFDPSQVPEDDRSFDVMPVHECMMQIIESKEIKKENGHVGYTFTVELLTGPHASRRVWPYMTYSDPNPKASGAGQRLLLALCEATGVDPHKIKDTDELNMKPFLGKVTVRRPSEKDIAAGYTENKNSIEPKRRAGSPTAAQSQKPAAQQQTSAKPTQGDKPWKKSA